MNATYSFFIDPEYFYNQTEFDRNIDFELIVPSLIRAQQNNIRQLIGESLFDVLMDGLNNSTLTATQSTLVNQYIAPSTARWTAYHAVSTLKYRMTNKSVSEKRSDYSSPTDFNQMISKKNEMNKEGMLWDMDIVRYILKNIGDFPEACHEICGCPHVLNFYKGRYNGPYLTKFGLY